MHTVLTTKLSLCHGGHLYNIGTFGRSLFAYIMEHFFGASITNTEHSSSGIMLFKIVVDYLERLESGNYNLNDMNDKLGEGLLGVFKCTWI